MKIYNLPKFLLIILLVALSISPAFALGEGNRNLLLIGIMYFTPLIVLYYPEFYKRDIWLLFFVITIILFPVVFHPETLRWSTILYSIMFVLSFMAYNRLLFHAKKFTIEDYLKILKYLIYAYVIVLLIQQFCVLTHLPVFNLSGWDPQTPWKLNSLTSEPSQSVRVMALLVYCYVTIKELIDRRKYDLKKDLKKDRWIWLGFVWFMVTSESATAFLLLPVVLLKFIRLKNVLQILAILIIVAFFVRLSSTKNVDRAYKTFIATLTMNPNKIIHADQSGAQRIVPLIFIFKKMDLKTMDGWFGYGIGSVSSFMYKEIPGTPQGTAGGGVMQLALDFGLISALFFVIFSFLVTYNKRDLLSIVFWILLVLLNGVNSQISWLTISLLFSNKFFYYKLLKHA